MIFAASDPNRLIQEANRLHAMVQSCIEQVAELPPPLEERSPGPGRWSPLQVVEHIVLSERTVFGVPTPLEDRPLSTPKWRHHCGRLLVFTVLTLRIPVPVPEAAMSPAGKTPLHRLRRILGDIHIWLEESIGSVPSEMLGRPLFHHPITGPMTLAQALRLNRLHIAAHQRHLEDLIITLTT